MDADGPRLCGSNVNKEGGGWLGPLLSGGGVWGGAPSARHGAVHGEANRLRMENILNSSPGGPRASLWFLEVKGSLLPPDEKVGFGNIMPNVHGYFMILI